MTSEASFVAGVDEAGRGPLAGPVVAAAVILPPDAELPGLRDSKKLSEKKRTVLFDQIKNNAIAFAIEVVDHTVIDQINILAATLHAMQQAVLRLSTKPSAVFIDGNQSPKLVGYHVETIIKGDDKISAISAASVLAKVTRDQLMIDYDQRYPGYGFAQHKGYGTQRHMAALQRLGPSPIHRCSFAPVAKCQVPQTS